MIFQRRKTERMKGRVWKKMVQKRSTENHLPQMAMTTPLKQQQTSGR